ncbi:MAG: DUF4258 domain-containing protein [Chloroflexi bacterium]|nr:DUF4258 domain-containing protein [Chloroflexota bacterium]
MASQRVIFRVHAIQRMFERSISEQDVHEVLRTAEVVEMYPDDIPYPSRLLLGWSQGQPIHVVVAENDDEETAIVITVYEPDDDVWEPGFRRRLR